MQLRQLRPRKSHPFCLPSRLSLGSICIAGQSRDRTGDLRIFRRSRNPAKKP
jgi:hypothetical protein